MSDIQIEGWIGDLWAHSCSIILIGLTIVQIGTEELLRTTHQLSVCNITFHGSYLVKSALHRSRSPKHRLPRSGSFNNDNSPGSDDISLASELSIYTNGYKPKHSVSTWHQPRKISPITVKYTGRNIDSPVKVNRRQKVRQMLATHQHSSIEFDRPVTRSVARESRACHPWEMRHNYEVNFTFILKYKIMFNSVILMLTSFLRSL